MILLDTCVISEVAKRAPNPAVAEWFEGVAADELWLSVVTVGEIRYGVELLEPGRRRRECEAWLARLVDTYGDRVLAVTLDVARRWGDLRAAAKRSGRLRPPIDTLIAATAGVHGLKVATRNVSDFEGCGVEVVDPWAFPWDDG